MSPVLLLFLSSWAWNKERDSTNDLFFSSDNQIKKVLFIGSTLWEIPAKKSFIFLKEKVMVAFFLWV